MSEEEEIISVTPDLIHELFLPPRLVSSKKGDNGNGNSVVLVIGGSGIYHGAPLLSTLAALRSGVDLVYTAVPKSVVAPLRSFSPNVIALSLSTNDRFTTASAKQLLRLLPKKPDVVAIGMGMSIKKPESLKYMVKELKNLGIKLLLDASALIPEILQSIAGTNTIITPHLGEYKRLFQKEKNYQEITEVNATTTTTTMLKEQTSNVYKIAKKYGITIILKGYNDIICDGSNQKQQQQQQQHKTIAVIKRPNPAMTVGGCGDVLSGVVSGLLTKMQAFSASIAGVYLSGIAADLAYQRVGLHMIATDLIEELPNSMKPFDKINHF